MLERKGTILEVARWSAWLYSGRGNKEGAVYGGIVGSYSCV